MLEELKREANLTRTENGAATPATTDSDCLYLFATVGALRDRSDSEIEARFLRAYAENPDLAMKILFYARDVRGGLGERKVFRVMLRYLAQNHRASVQKNLHLIAEYGRWDDLLELLDTPCKTDALTLIKTQLEADLQAMRKNVPVSLLGKWLPSVNASNAETVRTAKCIARSLKMQDAEYRRTLSALRSYIRILENNLRTRDYTFCYEQQPAGAMFKYRKAFLRNDEERYCAFLNRVREGSAVMHTGTLAPYEIISPILQRNISADEAAAIDTTWNALEDFTNGENALAVIDGSGSMYRSGDASPAAVALSLGIYLAQRNTGAFRNHFITFSARPQLVEIKGRDIAEQVRYCESFNEVANTDLYRVFTLILQTAVRNKLPQKDLPSTLYIISDMEFDRCTENAGLTNFAYAKQTFAEHGYRLPKVVFWNVDSRNRQQPVRMNEQGVVLVSGCTPRIFSMMASGKLTPYELMLEVLGSERYASVAA